MDTFGAAIGPFAALVFLYYYPGQYKSLFLLAFIPALVGVGITFLVKDRPSKEAGKHHKPGFFSYLKYWNLASADYKKLVIGLLLFALINSSDAFLLLFMKYKGLGDKDLILVYIFYNLVYAVAAYPMGILADKLGMRWSIFIGLLLFASVYFFILSANSIYFFGIVFFAYGIYAAATEGVAKAWITNLTDKKHTATAIGFFTSLSSICTMLASAIAGMLWEFSRPETLFYISAGMAAVLAIYFITVPIHNIYKPVQEQL
jgi:MFS family permease